MTDHTPRQLPLPPQIHAGRDATCDWVTTHLRDVTAGPVTASATIRGGDTAAQQALGTTNLDGYATTRNRVWPESSRGATALSAYIRHGMLSLPALWTFAGQFDASDREKFRDELLWQEYARHLYARLGRATARPLRHTNPAAAVPGCDVTLTSHAANMACLTDTQAELEDTGFLTNQQRLWLASHFTVRHGLTTAAGEDLLYRQLLDGSRAANRLGWQWVSGEATGRAFMFTRRQVERYAPGVCEGCALARACPITTAPPDPVLVPIKPNPKLRRDDDPDVTGGPTRPVVRQPDTPPAAVWVTAESLSVHDPAVAAHPELPVVFVFDTPLLHQLMLSGKRLVFLAETLADLATSRTLLLWRGATTDVLAQLNRSYDGAGFAATFTPVRGFATRSTYVTTLHPWPWLRRPHDGPVTSYTAWRKHGDTRT